ncbi:unnamed protein product [Caenorhabditis brenneri]
MHDQPITHKSPSIGLSSTLQVLESTNNNGVKCDWSGSAIYDNYYGYYTGVNLSWAFDWSELMSTGAEKLSGHITVTSSHGIFTPQKIDVDFTTSIQRIETSVNGLRFHPCDVIFEYSLISYRAPIQEVFYEEMFLPSTLNDTILVVDGKKLHVNKVFLSYHSDYFAALFSSNYKEGQMDEIPIQDITFEDFGLMMGTIYPKFVFPNDKTAEKLLELADRFIIPSVIGHVEYHLLHNSLISNEKKIWLADAYGMKQLFEKCFRELNTVEKVKKLGLTPEYEKLSKDAKSTILDCLMKLI